MIDIIGFINGWHLERFIAKLFKSSQKLWNAINPIVQEVIKQSSAVVELITKAENMTPQFIFDKITEVLPFFTKEKLDEVLIKVGKVSNLVTDVNNPDVLEVIANIDKKIMEAHPDDKEGVAHTIATWIATFATPPETTFGVITSIMKLVFTTFVKGKYQPFN